MMDACFQCGLPKVGEQATPRYDVMKPGVDLSAPDTYGPYCVDCWATTATAALLIAKGEPL